LFCEGTFTSSVKIRGFFHQIARVKGACIVGIAGGPEKCRYVTEELGFDACI
jgi:NADPH-dependent curcumin reductase CurA